MVILNLFAFALTILALKVRGRERESERVKNEGSAKKSTFEVSRRIKDILAKAVTLLGP